MARQKSYFRVTLALIQDHKTNEKMLRKIEARCLKFAHIDGAIADPICLADPTPRGCRPSYPRGVSAA
jgi:hypothetical protein